MRHKHAQKRVSKEFPSVYEIDRPWKTDVLRNLPQEELRSWYDNMRAGHEVGENKTVLRYIMGDGAPTVLIVPDKIILPDGSSILVEDDGKTMKEAKERIIGQLKTCVKDGDAPVIIKLESKGDEEEVITMTQNEMIENIIDSQFELLSDLGVERYGAFENMFGALRHKSYESVRTITLPIDQILRKPSRDLFSRMLAHVGITERQDGGVYCEYHTHMGRGNIYPSLGDVIYMTDKKHSSAIIGARENDGSYRVAEWRVKKGVDLEKELDERVASRKNPLEWPRLGDMRKLVDELFDRRVFTLRDVGDKVVMWQVQE